MSEDLAKVIITSMATIVSVYIVNVAAKKVQSNRESRQPKDRIEQIFDGYDKALKQRDLDIKDLRYNLSEARHTILKLTEDLEEAEKKAELSMEESRRLGMELDSLRRKYRVHRESKTQSGV